MQDPAGGGVTGKGTVDQVKLKNAVKNWGILPPNERNAILQDLTSGLSPADAAVIEAYFRNIAMVKTK